MIESKPILERRIWPGIRLAHALLGGIVLLSVVLHFSNLSAIGDANLYYTAAVKSMLRSWRNFFFVAAEPGGSVSVDKPPLGLWVEAAFAWVLGVSGFSTSLPNMLAGVLSVPLLYALVSRQAGRFAGLAAALVLVITPVALATDRNNTMDGLLVLTLLLAAWAFWLAAERGGLGWLLLGALLVGLGFNIKMLQAFLPLPAFYALYVSGAPIRWRGKLVSLALATVLLLIVSFAWALAVDLTPADERPYVGSSQDNTVTELIIGHNGLARLFNPRAGNPPGQAPAGPAPVRPVNPPPGALEACSGRVAGDLCSFRQPNGALVQGRCAHPPADERLACIPPQPGGIRPPPGALGDGPGLSPNPSQSGGTPFSQETGLPGIWRFFVFPLSKQMSWLLPYALLGLFAALAAARRTGRLAAQTLSERHKALILWGGWLLTCLIFFSSVEGIFHAYYTIMLAPPLGALVGMGAAQALDWHLRRAVGLLWVIVISAVTLAFQVFAALQYGYRGGWLYFAGLVFLAGAALSIWPLGRKVGFGLLFGSVLLIPLYWTGMTAFDPRPNASLPTASSPSPGQPGPPVGGGGPAVEGDLLAYLQAHTQDVEYLIAVPSAQLGAPLVLATGRPVLYLGGFSGGDPVIDAAGLAKMVQEGRLRYVLFSPQSPKVEIARWLASACQVVPQFDGDQVAAAPGQQRPVLYRCE